MTIAFCSVLRFAVGSDFGSKRIFKPGTTAVIVSILFTIFLFTAKDSLFSNWDQPSLARLVCAAPFVLSLGILVSVTTFTVVFGNRLRGNGCKKTTLVLFMIGCIGLMWHSVNWVNWISIRSRKMSVYREAKPFFDKYRELSQEAPVIPIDCNNYGARDTRIEWPLRLAGLADEGDLRFFHEEEKWQEVLSTIAIPSYVLTERDAEFLAQVAPGFQVVPVPNASYIGCSFYLIRHSQVSNEATGEAVPAQWP